MRSTHLMALAVALVPIAVSACDERRQTATEPARETQTTGAQKPTVDDVKDDPSRFYGKRITLTGEVDDVKNDRRSFDLEGNDWLFKDEIRVFTRGPVKLGGTALANDDHVVVTGTLRRFVRADLDRELGWDLQPELEVDLKEKPVLVADEIRRLEGTGRWTAQEPEGEIVSVVALITAVSPDALAGQKIALDRTWVQTVTGKGFWVGSSHADQTFVMPPAGFDVTKLKAGDPVRVRGTVRKTPPADEAVKAWGVPPELRGTVAREPLFIEASQVEPSPGGAKQAASDRGGPESSAKRPGAEGAAKTAEGQGEPAMPKQGAPADAPKTKGQRGEQGGDSKKAKQPPRPDEPSR